MSSSADGTVNSSTTREPEFQEREQKRFGCAVLALAHLTIVCEAPGKVYLLEDLGAQMPVILVFPFGEIVRSCVLFLGKPVSA